MALLTLDQVKSALSLTLTTNDAFLQLLIDSISLQVERYTAKRFEPTPAFDGSGDDTLSPVSVTVNVDLTPAASAPLTAPVLGGWRRSGIQQPVAVTIPHARQITAVTWGTDAVDTTQYATRNDVTLRDPFIRRLIFNDPALQPVDTVTVTGRFGVVPVPTDITVAALFMVSRQSKERDAGFGDSVQLSDGSIANYFRQYPPWVKATFDGYCEIGA